MVVASAVLASSWEVEAERQSHHWQQIKFKATLGYIRPRLRIKQNKSKDRGRKENNPQEEQEVFCGTGWQEMLDPVIFFVTDHIELFGSFN